MERRDASGCAGRTERLAHAESVELVGHIGGVSHAVAVQGGYAYLGEGLRLTVLVVSNPTAPIVVGRTAPMPGVVQDVRIHDGHAYVTDSRGGLRVVRIDDPARPTEVSHYETPGRAWGIYVSGGLVYVADGSAGLLILRRAGAADDSRREDVTS